MKKLQNMILICLVLNAIYSKGQVGINTPLPHPSAALEVEAKNQGFLPPRVALKSVNDKTTIVEPAQGLLVFNTSFVQDNKNSVYNGYYYYDGTKWVMLKGSDHTWGTMGNYGTNKKDNFIGTIDDQDIVFKRNSQLVGLLSDTNFSLGIDALKKITTGRHNVALGYMDLAENTTGSFNTAIGATALSSNLADYNTAVGHAALSNVTSGGANTAVGNGASQNLKSGSQNTSLGYNSAYRSFSGEFNTNIGSYSGYSNGYGHNNTSLGYQSLYFNNKGSNNTALGTAALYSNLIGNNNVAVGNYALYDLKSVDLESLNTDNNVALGNKAGIGLENGNDNIFIGSNTRTLIPNSSNQLNIGNSIFGVNINADVITRIGINQRTPHISAVLDLGATNLGFLPPRVALKSVNDKTTIIDPAQGLLVFNTSLVQDSENSVYKGYYYFNGTNWVMLKGSEHTWGTTGNYATNSDNNFIGTIDNQDLIFKRGNVQAGLLSSISTYNTSFGVNTYKGTPKGSYAGRWNTAIGYSALSGKDGIVSGHDNTAVGANTLAINTSGRNNVGIGSASLLNNTSGENNTAVGFQALHSNIQGNDNVAVGRSALSSTTYGNGNTAIGFSALDQNVSGKLNTAIGYLSGPESGYLSNTTAIGNNTTVNASNTIRLGNKEIEVIYGQVGFSNVSDNRTIQDSNPLILGLDLINKLKPLEYVRVSNQTKSKEWGITAQDIKESLQELNYSNAGLIESDKSSDQVMLLRYNDLIAPMIKAIQQLSRENSELKSRLEILESTKN